MKSVWIGVHAIEQYARRVERRDPATLTKDERLAIRGHLLELYRRSKDLREVTNARGRVKPGQVRRLCALRFNGRLVLLVLVCAPDDKHHSHAYKMVTVYTLHHRKQKRK